MIERDTTCLLDFYIHESVQRQGIGAELFRSALKVDCLADGRRCTNMYSTLSRYP